MRTLAITRWNLNGPEVETHLFADDCILELHGEAGVVAVCSQPSDEGGESLAYFFGVSAVQWLEDE